MEATISNMERFYPIYGTHLVILADNGDEFSADPHDYFWCNDKDYSFGRLLVKGVYYNDVDEDVSND